MWLFCFEDVQTDPNTMYKRINNWTAYIFNIASKQIQLHKVLKDDSTIPYAFNKYRKWKCLRVSFGDADYNKRNNNFYWRFQWKRPRKSIHKGFRIQVHYSPGSAGIQFLANNTPKHLLNVDLLLIKPFGKQFQCNFNPNTWKHTRIHPRWCIWNCSLQNVTSHAVQAQYVNTLRSEESPQTLTFSSAFFWLKF